MGILEARGESNLRKLETELRSQTEKEVKSRYNYLHIQYYSVPDQ